jgi:glycosyltransferase involved in cell wall biosynthesis
MTADAVGGVWAYALELARALAPHGVHVAIAAMGGPFGSAQREQARKLSNVSLFESRFKLEWMGDPWLDVARAGEWLLQLEAWVKPDLVHLNGYAHAALPWRAPVLVAGHSCVLSWWKAVRGGEAPAQWDRYRSEVARGLAAADAVICPSAAMLAALREHYVVPQDARVVPNGRDPQEFQPAPKKPLILAAGRLWDEAKNISALERIAPRLSWPVYLAGEDGHPEGGRAAFRRARFLGCLAPDALAEWYGCASIYALPARYEPFGLTALEAALSGCCLVLGDIPSLREIWAGSALFVPPGDDEALASALKSLIRDPDRRAGWQARAQAQAMTYTPERMAAGYLAAYRDLTLGRKTASAG